MTTYSDLFDNNTTHINDVSYVSGTKTLSIVFNADLTPAQAAAAVLQSLNNFLKDNTDESINLQSSAPTRNASFRNNVAKDSISMSFQIYVPSQEVVFDPATV